MEWNIELNIQNYSINGGDLEEWMSWMVSPIPKLKLWIWFTMLDPSSRPTKPWIPSPRWFPSSPPAMWTTLGRKKLGKHRLRTYQLKPTLVAPCPWNGNGPEMVSPIYTTEHTVRRNNQKPHLFQCNMSPQNRRSKVVWLWSNGCWLARWIPWKPFQTQRPLALPTFTSHCRCCCHHVRACGACFLRVRKVLGECHVFDMSWKERSKLMWLWSHGCRRATWIPWNPFKTSPQNPKPFWKSISGRQTKKSKTVKHESAQKEGLKWFDCNPMDVERQDEPHGNHFRPKGP